MALRVALGSYRPYLLPAFYENAGSAILNAKSIFETLQKKVEVSVWDTTHELGVATGDCIARINAKSYDGPNSLSTPADYPAEREPKNILSADIDPGYTLAELGTQSDLIAAPASTLYYGPFQVDGNYITDNCGDNVKVLYDVDPDNTGASLLAIGPLGLSSIPQFEWKYKAVPSGIDPTRIPWSAPEGPTHTFTGLIPGLTYSFLYSDEAEEIV